MKKSYQFFLLIFLCEIVGFSTVPVTLSSIPAWYAGLIKPAFSPPNWIFGPVWTLLYGLMGAALFFVLKTKARKREKKAAVRFFILQLFFNFLWSLLFFGAHEPLFAFVDLIALLFSLGITIYFFRKISYASFYMLIPYFLWVCFAGVLNLFIILLNK